MALMKPFILLAFSIFTAATSIAEIKVVLGEWGEVRTTGRFPEAFPSEVLTGLEMELKLSGAELAQAKVMRIILDKAVEDTGKSLVRNARELKDGKVWWSGISKGSNDKVFKLKFENPSRAAQSISLTGFLELFIPENDPACVVTATTPNSMGKQLENPVLKAAGVELKVVTPQQGKEINYTIYDPQGNVAAVEIPVHDMNRFIPNGLSRTFLFKPTTGDATVRIYLRTEKSVVKAPIKFDNLLLP